MYPPLVEHLHLQVRFNVKSKAVELRTSSLTTDPGALQKGADFIQAFVYGFDVEDAIALLRLDHLYALDSPAPTLECLLMCVVQISGDL